MCTGIPILTVASAMEADGCLYRGEPAVRGSSRGSHHTDPRPAPRVHTEYRGLSGRDAKAELAVLSSPHRKA